MRRIGWGRRLRTALKAEGLTRTSKAGILDGLRNSAASMGEAAADAFWEGVESRPDLPQAVRDTVAIDISAEIDAAIRSILKEWGIPRSTESERMAEVAEAAFKSRLTTLAAGGGAA